MLEWFALDLFKINLVTVVVRLLLSALLGAAIGIDRERQNQTAGLRTHMLICVGSALAALTNEYITTFVSPEADASRLAAQVISGIGFLGVGTIIVGRQKVRGLTTAAGMWACACTGLAAGIGFYEGAVTSALLIVVILAALRWVDNVVHGKGKIMFLYIEMSSMQHFERVQEAIEASGLKVTEAEFSRIRSDESHVMSVDLKLKQPKRREQIALVARLAELDGVLFVKRV